MRLIKFTETDQEELVRLLQKAAEEIQNLYGHDTDLTEQLYCKAREAEQYKTACFMGYDPGQDVIQDHITSDELFSIQTDNNKLKSLYAEMASTESLNPYRKNIISDMPKGGTNKNFNDRYVERKERIQMEIDFYEKKLQEDRRKIDEYIEAAPLPEKDIIRFRVINNLGWDEIGQLLGMNRRTASRKFYKYIKVAHNARQDVL